MITATNQAWRLDAACLYVDPDLFFPEGDQVEKTEQAKAAIKICDSCPVKAECLSAALMEEKDVLRHDYFGIRGGARPYARWKLNNPEQAERTKATETKRRSDARFKERKNERARAARKESTLEQRTRWRAARNAKREAGKEKVS